MMPLRPHRWWIALLVLAIVLMAGSGPALDYARDQASRNLADVKTARMKAEQDLRQLQTDVATARKLSGQIDRAQAEQVLAPVDRLKTVAELEKEAQAAKLLHFTYTLAPEQRVSLSAGGEAQELAQSSVALSGDAPDDRAIYAFIEHARTHMAGRARLQQLTVTRISPAGAPPAAVNVHFEASFEWLSNGALQTMAAGP